MAILLLHIRESYFCNNAVARSNIGFHAGEHAELFGSILATYFE